MAVASESIASSWPNTVSFRSRSRLRSNSLSELLTCFGESRNLRHDVLDLLDIDALDPLPFGLQTLIGAGLVDHVDGLVRHMAIIDVARGQPAAARNASSLYSML